MTCQRCKESNGWIVISTPDNWYTEHMERCTCTQTQAVQNRIGKEQLVGFELLTFTTFEAYDANTLEIKDKARIYLKNPKHSFLLLGESGRGKTHLAMAIANNLLAKKHGVLVFKYRDEIRKMQSAINTPEFEKMMYRFRNCEYLVIDELFKSKPSESELKIMYEIIDHRAAKGKSMIITSEKTLNDLMDIDEALLGRIYQSCHDDNNICVIVGGQNYRLIKK